MNGIVEGVIGNAITNSIGAFARKISGRQIQITYPRPLETLTNGEALNSNNVAFPVRGSLKRLPALHEIWVLTQDDSTGLLWPQGFFPVQYDPIQGTWLGKINGSGKKQVRIIAVVAPPTSQDFFKYFQTVGHLRDYKFEPLKRLPPECRNVTSVQAIIP
jgi:hypothetical protein